VSSNDFDGPHAGPAGARGADEQGAQSLGDAGQGARDTGQGADPSAANYPAPEGWGNDGFWRDSAIDSNYETGMQRAVPTANAPHEDPGYSYFSDGRGWESKPGATEQPGQAPAAGAPGVPGVPAPGMPAAGATAASATAIGATTVGAYGAGGDATSVYAAGPGGPGGYGAPVPPGPGGPAGYGPGPGGPFGAGPGGPFGPGPGGPGGPGGPFGPGGPVRPGGPQGPNGGYGKRKGNWWRHWTWKKALALTGGVFVIFVIALFGGYQYMASGAVIPQAATSATVQDTTIYYSDGKTVLGTIGQTNRQDLAYSQIPMMLQNAVVSAEDKNFWTEGGISPTGILRAAMHDVTSSGDLNGGSTITQEFVRNYYDGVGTQQTASRKIKEIFIAQKVAGTYSKQWIMEHYLNTIYMGDGANGMEAAAETYFGVSATKLTPSQDALLAGMIQAPSTYYLPSNRQSLKVRWDYVLGQMVKNGYLTQAQADAQTFPKLLTDKASGASSAGVMANGSDPWAPYILTQVDNELTTYDGLTPQQLATGGYKVVTTISHSMEEKMYAAVNDTVTPSAIAATGNASLPSIPNWMLVGAQLQDTKTGEIIAEYPGKGQNVSATACDGVCQENTVSQARNQVGSSFKPYVLSTAVQQDMNVQSSVLDTSPYVCVAADQSSTYSVPLTASVYAADSAQKSCELPGGYPVENDGGEQIGKQVGQATSGANKGATYWSNNVQGALAASSNTGFTDLAHKVGTQNIINMAAQYGVNTTAASFGTFKGGVGIALGIAPLTVQEQDTMLATIADNGYYHQAHLVKYWQSPGLGSGEQAPKVQSHSVLTAQQAGDVQYAMEDTTFAGGTAYPSVTYGLNTPGMVISKTGTTTGSQAGYFIGATTQYSLTVGMFTKDPSTAASQNLSMLGGQGFGGYWPAKIWNALANTAFSQSPQLFTTSPDTTGQQAWNMLGPVPKAAKKKACTETFNGQQVSIVMKGCPTPQSKNCTLDTKDNYVCGNGLGNGNNGNGNGNGNGNNPNPNPTCTTDNNGNTTCSGGATPTASPTCQFPGDPTCNNNGNGGGGNSPNSSTPTASTAQGGLVVGGGLTALPGSLLWATTSRRRRRKKRAATAE
jgi:membrane peptidoglycan carboxypeptidase